MTTPHKNISPKILSQFDKSFQSHLEDLKDLIRIPSVSFSGFPAAEVDRCATAVSAILKKRGLENVQILRVSGGHPYVYGEWLKAGPERPTILLYAHYDVQPPGREAFWESKPFDPVLRNGQAGERLFGRGSADDKAGIIVHTAAISAFLECSEDLPVNVKVIIEGEEEIGSTHLPQFLQSYRKLLDAQTMVITDTNNFDSGIPALTVALRGLVEFDVEVRSLTKSVHSGGWGGPVPDPVMALTKMLSALVDDNGRIAVPGVLDQMSPISENEMRSLEKIPYDEKAFREQAGMLPSVKLLKEGPSPAVQVWRYPSLTINAIQASSRQQPSNIINDIAWAKVTIRLVPGMEPNKVAKTVKAFLEERAPWGVEVHCKSDMGGGPAWAADTAGPVFEAARRALEKGFGAAPYQIGSGGSISFVRSLTDALGGIPALLVGVEDPYSNAHGENESVLVSDLKKACLSQIYLFAEIAELASKKL